MPNVLHRTRTRIVLVLTLVLAVLVLGQAVARPVLAQPAPCADLVITNLSVSPNPATEDANATVSVTVKNQGTCASLSFVVQWRDNAGALAQPVLGNEDVNGLNAGAQTTLNMSYVFPDPGTFTTVVDVDTDRTVDETNENNNQEIFDVVVNEARPDLFVSSFTVVPSNPAAGQSTQVNIKVKNGGPVAAGPFIVQWKSNSTFLTPEGPSQQVDGLAAGATKTVSFNYIFPDPGDFQTQVSLDTDNTVVESNEDNNLQIFPVLVSESLPDLEITGFDIKPEYPLPSNFPADQPVAGENATIRIGIKNRGNAPSVSFVVQWKSDEFAPLGASSATVPGLGVGESTVVELTAVFQRAGEYETVVEIDTDRTVQESNELNNIQIAWVRVQPRVTDVAVIKFEVLPAPGVVTSLPPDPDDNLELNPAEATKLNPVVNRLTKAKITVKNIGNVPVNSFQVEWKPTQPGAESFEQLVPGLLPGQVSNHVFDYTYNRTGDFVSQATADSLNTVRPEADEENNVATYNVRVEAELPDLVITKFWIMPPSPVAGTEAELVSELYVKIRNRGNSPAGVFNVQVRPQPLADLDSQQIPGLGVHETIVVKFNHVYPRAGEFTANARVDPPIQRVEELFETNNTADLVVTVQPPTDDLDVIDIEILPNPHNEVSCPAPDGEQDEVSVSKFGQAEVNQNEPVKVCIYIQNLGNSPMRQFMVEWNPAEGVFPPLNSEGPATIKKQIDELSGGQVALVEFDFVYERAGEFRTLTFADADNVIREANEENNREIYNVVVNGTGPDLTILDLFIDTSNPVGPDQDLPRIGDAFQISREHQEPELCQRNTTPDDNSPTSVLEGRKIYGCVVVKNQGNRPSGPFVVEWNPDSFGLITQSPQTVSSQVANLEPGQEMTLAFGYTYPQAGEFRSVATADAFNNVVELQEGNNQKIRDVVSIAQGPDLDITGISIQQQGRDITAAGVEPTLIQGQPIEVSITVKNIGSLPAGPFLLEWNPAEGAFPALNPNGPSTLEKQIGGLGVGQSTTVKFDFTYDSTGGFRTLANADSTNTVEELNEDNNMDIFNVVVNPAPLDLRITDFVVNNGSNPVRSSQVPVDVTIRNDGDYPTESFSLQFKPLGEGGAFGPQQRIDGLQPNETRTVRFDVVFSVAGEGNQVIQSQAIIDTRNEIPETNEGNNTRTENVTVLPRETNMTVNFQNINVQQGDNDTWAIGIGVYAPGTNAVCDPEVDGDKVLDEPIEDFSCVLLEDIGSLDNGETGSIDRQFTITLVDSDPLILAAFALEYDVDKGFLGIGADVDITQRGLAFQLWGNRDYLGVGSDQVQAIRDEANCCYLLNYDVNINSAPPILAAGAEEPALAMMLPSSWHQIMPKLAQLPEGVSIAEPTDDPTDNPSDPTDDPPTFDNKVYLPSITTGN